RIKDINRALVKAFIVCRIPFYIIENPFFVELLKTLRPAYEPPSKDVLFGRYLAQETAFVNQARIKQLTDSKNLTIEENLIEGGGLKQWVDTRWHTMYDCIRNNNSDIVNTSVQAILHTKAFFDDLNALVFVLYPIKMAIATLESQDCSLADCFVGLVCLETAIKRLPEKIIKLSAFYLANSKKELQYFSAYNDDDELHEALSNMDLGNYDDYDEGEQPTSNEVQDDKFLEEEMLKIEELLNIDVADFMNDLEEDGNIQNNDVESNVDEDNWDPKKEAESMLD
ncbi:10960_t:CDS:2, partial [Gigaspora rosea]